MTLRTVLPRLALGLTRIHFTHYVVASFICMAPGAIAFTYLGHARREAFAGSETMARTGLIALGLLALAAFLPRIVRRIRAAGPGEPAAKTQAEIGS